MALTEAFILIVLAVVILVILALIEQTTLFPNIVDSFGLFVVGIFFSAFILFILSFTKSKWKKW